MAPRSRTSSNQNTSTTAKDDNPTEFILTYLRSQNRPYSATDISSNLHNRVTKAKADKLLKELKEKGEVGGSTTGKMGVYWCLQNPEDAASPSELAALDSSISTLRELLPNLKAELKSKTTALATLRSAPTTAALRKSIEELTAQTRDGEARLVVLREGGVKPVSKEERERTELEHKYWVRKREGRRRMFRELEGLVSEGMGLGRGVLWDELGLDGDDES